MARSLFDPSRIDDSIRKLSTGKGPAFTHLFQYLSFPNTKQLVAPTDRPYFLKNLRSDLSSWRTALSQVPPSRLLTIPWLSLIAESRADLIGKTDHIKTLILMENIRLYTTQLRPEGLYIGSYLALGTSFEPPLTFITPDQLEPQQLTDPEETPYRQEVKPRNPAAPLYVPKPLTERLQAVPEIANRYFNSTKRSPFVTLNEPDEEIDDLAPLLAEQKALQDEQIEILTHESPSKVRMKEIDARLTQIKKLLDNMQ